jgi:hypothetical protein
MTAFRPLRTAPSIVSGQPVSVHEPASTRPGSPVAAFGRSLAVPGTWRNVARFSRVTKNSVTVAALAAGNSSASAGTNCSRSSPTGLPAYSSAADREIARYWPESPRSCIPEIRVRSNTHCTGESTAAANGTSMTLRS